MLVLPKFTFGMGDRFGKQALAQLDAVLAARQLGIDVAPTWNKSFREHSIIGTEPQSLRDQADAAIATRDYKLPYFIDADHIRMETVDGFMAGSNFFTLDVADFVGEAAAAESVEKFKSFIAPFVGQLEIDGIAGALDISAEAVEAAAGQFLKAVEEAAKIYQHIAASKAEGSYAIEVSADETDKPQSPTELLLILAMLAMEGVPAQTIAPKFTGRFNKGVDYVGDLEAFDQEFSDDLAVIAWAVENFELPKNLKLSVHSGSDKFSIYPAIKKHITRTGAGLHVKTAGTTWLEELIGLAEAGGRGLEIAKDVYRQAFDNCDALCAPYATVIDIDKAQLPSPDEVDSWTSEQFTSALRHDQSNPEYNQHLRQLLHVGFKIAAKMGDDYLNALEEFSECVNRNVTLNLLERHLKPLFLA